MKTKLHPWLIMSKHAVAKIGEFSMDAVIGLQVGTEVILQFVFYTPRNRYSEHLRQQHFPSFSILAATTELFETGSFLLCRNSGNFDHQL